MREAIRRPALLARRVRSLRLASFSCLSSSFSVLLSLSLVSCLSSPVPVLALRDLFPLLRFPSRPPHSARPSGSTLLERTFFASFSRSRFLSLFPQFLAPFGLPKSTKNREKTEKMAVQIRLCFPIAFFMDLSSLLDGPNLEKS